MRKEGYDGQINNGQRNTTVGLLAHVDAGKTTLAESILYLSGALRRLGRVDHQDTFLDTYSLERERGITIFSKQARVKIGERQFTLLDTPGHVDFSAEMERTLQVLDAAVLVIDGADGVVGHTETLWRLLQRYQVPVFVFVNKMDQQGTDREKLMKQLKEKLDGRLVELAEENLEDIAVCGEHLMEEYLETGALQEASIAKAVAARELFPCYFGSALKLTGIEQLLAGVEQLAPRYGGDTSSFGARVYKISRDSQGARLTHLKITGGVLKVKELIDGEKADQLRLYSGTGFTLADRVEAGDICAVTGLKNTYSGQGLGCEGEGTVPMLEPVLTYRVIPGPREDKHKVLGQLRLLEEEIPELHIVWKEELREIHAQVMGEVQIEILKSLVKERFDMEVTFGAGSIVYKETLAESVEGIGHFEPLRHYAEVHLWMSPGERGSGVQVDSRCSEDVLDRNWQRLIMTHLEERVHAGVLVGGELTDVKITVIGGKAHLKHTEGGDFRQATYRAVRQGLRKAACVLLEPMYDFVLELPTESIGRAMSDLQQMSGRFEAPETFGDQSVLRGRAPVAAMGGYQREVNAYTGGRGHLTCVLGGYEPCHNAIEVVERSGYDPEMDADNPTGSVFCAHGAGYVVPWDQVDEYAHVPPLAGNNGGDGGEAKEDEALLQAGIRAGNGGLGSERGISSSDYVTQEEIDAIFARTYGTVKREENPYHKKKAPQQVSYGTAEAGDVKHFRNRRPAEKKGEYLLVDGYNIVFAWEELKELARVNLDSAREKLMDELCNYQGYVKCTLILVFDAYKVKGNPGSVEKYHNIHVVYTREAETADQYIEKTVHQIAGTNHVTVATSDALEQMIIWGQGAKRLSAAGLKEEIEQVKEQMRMTWREKLPGERHRPFEKLLEREDFND